MKENSLPVVQKLHVKIGDTVKVIAGHDKGKISTITQLYTHNSKILLKDVNLKTKHVKGKAEGEIGQIVQVRCLTCLTHPVCFIAHLPFCLLTSTSSYPAILYEIEH